MIKYFNGTQNKYLTPSDDDLKWIKWYVDARFAVHPDFKSHTRVFMTMGQEAMNSVYRKQ